MYAQALSTIRANDMVRLKGEYAVYDEQVIPVLSCDKPLNCLGKNCLGQVTITTPCSIVGDDETCMIINRQASRTFTTDLVVC